jgi:hypothetical protein
MKNIFSNSIQKVVSFYEGALKKAEIKREKRVLLESFNTFFNLSKVCASKTHTDFIDEYTLPIKLRNETIIEAVKPMLWAYQQKPLDFQFTATMEDVLDNPDNFEITEEGINITSYDAKLVLDLEALSQINIMDKNQRQRWGKTIMLYDMIEVCSNALPYDYRLDSFLYHYYDDSTAKVVLKWAIERMQKRIDDNNTKVSY